MKKLIGILGSLSLIVTSTSMVVSCANFKITIINYKNVDSISNNWGLIKPNANFYRDDLENYLANSDSFNQKSKTLLTSTFNNYNDVYATNDATFNTTLFVEGWKELTSLNVLEIIDNNHELYIQYDIDGEISKRPLKVNYYNIQSQVYNAGDQLTLDISNVNNAKVITAKISYLYNAAVLSDDNTNDVIVRNLDDILFNYLVPAANTTFIETGYQKNYADYFSNKAKMSTFYQDMLNELSNPDVSNDIRVGIANEIITKQINSNNQELISYQFQITPTITVELNENF